MKFKNRYNNIITLKANNKVHYNLTYLIFGQLVYVVKYIYVINIVILGTYKAAWS